MVKATIKMDGLGEGEYTELEFGDWGKKEGTIADHDVYRLTDPEDITSLNGVEISGKVNFGGNAERYFRVGGNDSLKYGGFTLITHPETGDLVLWAQGIGDVVIDHWMVYPEQWSELKNKDIDLRVTFNKDSKTGAWWGGVYINGEHLGQFNCGIVEPGMAIGVEPGVTIEGLGDIVKNASLDFTLFGYSNENWRKEMGLE